MDSTSIAVVDTLRHLAESLASVQGQLQELKVASKPDEIWSPVTSVIGAICGVAGLIVSIVSYKKTNSTHAQELRIQIKKNVHEAKSLAVESKDIAFRAFKSREAVSNVKGMLFSGMMEKFKQENQADTKTIHELTSKIPSVEKPWEKFSNSAIEKEIVNLHSVTLQLGGLKEKYQKILDDDDENRRFLRDQANRKV